MILLIGAVYVGDKAPHFGSVLSRIAVVWGERYTNACIERVVFLLVNFFFLQRRNVMCRNSSWSCDVIFEKVSGIFHELSRLVRRKKNSYIAWVSEADYYKTDLSNSKTANTFAISRLGTRS